VSCFVPPLAVIFLHAALLRGRDSLPQALDSDTAMLLPVFVLRFSPVVILFVEDVTQSSMGLKLLSEHVMPQLWRSASSCEK